MTQYKTTPKSGLMLWYVKSRKDLLFSDATDCLTACSSAVVRRTDVAIVVEAQVVRVVTVRRSRPVEAVVADTAQTAIAAVAITRSRVPSC